MRNYAIRNHISQFVETGTYRGDTLAVVRPCVACAFSIELEPRLATRARERFRRYPNVEIIEGDSAIELPLVLPRTDGPALFWLDGHYSSGATALGDKSTPIEEELAAVLDPDQPEHLVLVDDARLFTGTEYPSLERVRLLVERQRPGWMMSVVDDIIRIHSTRYG